MKLFGTSGIRRIADDDLFELAVKAGSAAGELYKDLVIACDHRISSETLKAAVISGARIAGADITDIGLAPTPTLAIAAERFGAGIMITASHNPPEYNGLKFVNPDGSAFDPSQQMQLEEMILSRNETGPDRGTDAVARIYPDAVQDHIQRILTLLPQKTEMKVVLDCGGGAASVISPLLLRKMGCEVIELNCTPDGNFPRLSEPTEKNLRDLIRKTGETGADVGIGHDGDADRMMAVDDKGRFIPGDKLLAIFAGESGDSRMVTTLDASMTIDESGLTVVRTKIGDNYVSEELKNGGRFGGEPSGSWVFPDISLCPDGMYAAARLISIASEKKLSAYVDEIPQYPILRTSMPIGTLDTGRITEAVKSMEPDWIDDRDGIKAGFHDGWVMIRPSGTEPILRLAVEAKDETLLDELYRSCTDMIGKYMD